MNGKDFMNKFKIKRNKFIEMVSAIEGSYRLDDGKWYLPDDAIPIYIPDKRYYKKETKKYCRVLDAIALNQTITKQFTGLDDDMVKTIVRELAKINAIALIEGKPENSLNYKDYCLSGEYFAWESKKVYLKNQMILEGLKILNNTMLLINH